MKICRKARGVFAALLICGSAAAAHGADRASIQLAAQSEKGNDYRVTNLVSDEPGEAPLLDPKLVNAWGIAASATSPWWVANNGTDSSTLYTGGGAKVALEVDVPGAPTGIVFNGGSSFQLAAGAPARFIFVSESGSFLAWNGGDRRRRIPGRSGVRLQGPRDLWRRPLHDRLHGVRGGSLRGELLRRHLRGFPHAGRLRGRQHSGRLLPVRHSGDRELDLRHVRQEGRHRRRGRRRERLRPRIRHRRESPGESGVRTAS